MKSMSKLCPLFSEDLRSSVLGRLPKQVFEVQPNTSAVSNDTGKTQNHVTTVITVTIPVPNHVIIHVTCGA